MNPSSDLIIHYVAVVIALVLVTGGWLVIAGLCVFALRRWTKGQIAKLPDGHEDTGGVVRWVLVAASFLFWPTAVVLGFYFLSKPETARTGQWCLHALLVYVTGSVLLAEAIVIGVAVFRPEWMMILG